MNKLFGTLWRSLLVGAGYTVTLMLGGMIVRVAGLNLPEVKDAQAILMWTFVGGTIAGRVTSLFGVA